MRAGDRAKTSPSFGRPYLVFAVTHFALATISFYFLLSQAVEETAFARETPQWVDSLDALTTALLMPLAYPLLHFGVILPWGAGFLAFLAASAANSLVVALVLRCVVAAIKGRHGSLCISVLLALPGLAIGQPASVEFRESVAVYGADIFPAITHLRRCGSFRVLVAYVNGTDLLFVDEVVASEDGSTFRVTRSFGFIEFNHYEASRSVDSVACQLRGPDSLQITGNGYEGHADEDFEFSIDLDTDSGRYEYSDTLD